MNTRDLKQGDCVKTPAGATLVVAFCDDQGVLVRWAVGDNRKVKLGAYYNHFEPPWTLLPKQQWIALFWRDELKNTVDSSTVYTSEEAVKLHCPTAFKYVQVQ